MLGESEGDVALVFHESEQPYKEIRRLITPKEHFQAACLVTDRRSKKDKFFQVAVLYTPEEHNSPCKLVKLTTGETFKPKFDEREVFRNCFLTEGNNILLFTRYYTNLYDSDFNLLTQIDKKTLHEHVWRINCCQPIVSGAKPGSEYILACEMKNFFKAKYKKLQPDHVYQGKKTEPTWLVKCEFIQEE